MTICQICGNGKQDDLEACDDGILFDGIGCKEDCSGSFPGWYCSGLTSNSASQCSTTCGDKIVAQNSTEKCDDSDPLD